MWQDHAIKAGIKRNSLKAALSPCRAPDNDNEPEEQILKSQQKADLLTIAVQSAIA